MYIYIYIYMEVNNANESENPFICIYYFPSFFCILLSVLHWFNVSWYYPFPDSDDGSFEPKRFSVEFFYI